MAYHSIIFAVGTSEYIEFLRLPYILNMLFGFAFSENSIRNTLCYTNQFIISCSVTAVLGYNIAICVDLIITL